MATSQNEVNRGSDHEASGTRPYQRQHVSSANRIPPTDDLQHRDSGEIRQRITRTRGAMDETLDELSQRLNPRHLIDDVLDLFRSPDGRQAAGDTAGRAGDMLSEVAGNVSRQIRQNPIGASLVGAGLAWLAAGNATSKSFTQSDRYDDPIYDPSDRDLIVRDDECLTYGSSEVGAVDFIDPELEHQRSDSSSAASQDEAGVLSAAGESISDASQSVRSAAATAGSKLSETAGNIVEGVTDAASSVASTASSLGSTTKDAGRSAYLRSRAASRQAAMSARQRRQALSSASNDFTQRSSQRLSDVSAATSDRVKRAHNDTPLAVGLGVLALGAIAGALIPRTRREDELLGESSDKAIQQARQKAEHAAAELKSRGESMAADTLKTVQNAAQANGLDCESLADRAGSVFEKATSTLAEAVQDEGLTPSQLKADVADVAETTKQHAVSEAQLAKDELKSTAVNEAEKLDSDAGEAVRENS